MHDSADQVDFDTVKVSRPSTAFNLFASPAFFRTGAAKKAFGDPQGFITALGEKFTDLASVRWHLHAYAPEQLHDPPLSFCHTLPQIQLLKPSAKVAKIVDITATADDDDGAAAALANAAAAAADMSKELLDSLPLEEVKKRTILQQQVHAALAPLHFFTQRNPLSLSLPLLLSHGLCCNQRSSSATSSA